MRTCDTCEHWRKLVNWHDRDDWTIKTEEEYWEAGIAMRTAEKGKVIGECLRYPPVTVSQEPNTCLLYTSPSPRDRQKSRMPSSA